MSISESGDNKGKLLKQRPLKRLFLLIIIIMSSIGNIMADITVSVPKKWKNRTVYVWQTDINQVFSRQEDEVIRQVKDTMEIKGLTFTLPLKLNCATKVSILTPKKDESDYDHTVAEACIMPGEDVHLYLDDNYVRAEGSLLNRQMAEIFTYYMQSLAPYETAYARGDQDETARLAKEFQQWYVDRIKQNPAAPGAGAALYQISNPELVVELSNLLQGDALTSLYYPYTAHHISRAQKILQRREAQRRMNKESVDAANFTLSDLYGSPVSLSNFKGKWVIVDFWGSWCAPCLKGMPELKEMYEAYSGRLEIIGVDCNDTEEAWKNAVARLQLPWVQLYQPKGGTVTATYGVTAYPTKVVIDPNGKIKKVYSGASPTFKEDMAEWLK